LATIKDVGNDFKLRARAGGQYVQVAVTDGKVSIWSDQQPREKAVELSQGQFGYLDLQRNTLQIDQFGVKNYLSWMNRRLQFQSEPLHKVSMQLSRIYDVSFAYSTYLMKKLSVTADFERKSLENVLMVIAMTLRIVYRLE